MSRSGANYDKSYAPGVTVPPSGDTTGATDTTAIQAAINTGGDVSLRAGSYYTNATITNGNGRFYMPPTANLYPTFLGDTFYVKTASPATVRVKPGFQPGAGDFSNTAAIRIGSGVDNPQQGSIAGSYIGQDSTHQFKGSGVIWDQGSMIDFSGVYITDVLYDGFRCTTAQNDNNHGYFNRTHVIRAAAIGYNIQAIDTSSGLNSRSHVFDNAKAFGCNQNYLIQSSQNVGSLFTETGTTADAFGPNAWGNFITMAGAPNTLNSWVDNAPVNAGNTIGGMNTFTQFSVIRALFGTVRINDQLEGYQQFTQSGARAFLDQITDTVNATTVTHNQASGGPRTDIFSGPVQINSTGAPGSAAPGSTVWSGSGAPVNTTGANGDFYLRSDTPGTANQRIYVRSAGAWVGIL